MSARELYRIGVALEDCVIALRQIRDNGPGLVAQHHDALNDAIAALSTLRNMRERAKAGYAERCIVERRVYVFGRFEQARQNGDNSLVPALLIPEPPETS